jgi:two-component system chemotaxis sensor kinase CheA
MTPHKLETIVRDFLAESFENLDQLDQDLLALEKDPTDRIRLAAIFRAIHTIKGTCGFFGYTKLEAVTHAGENLLSRLRDGVQTLCPEITTGLLRMVDAVREMLGRIRETRTEGTADYSDLTDTLTRLQSVGLSKPADAPPAKPGSKARPAKSTAPRPRPSVLTRMPDGPVPGGSLVLPSPLAAAPPTPTPSPAPPAVVPPPPPAPPEPKPEAKPAEPPKPADPAADGNIRVSVGLLDKLMNLVGELVLARNQVLQYAAYHRDAAFLSTTQRLNLITTELQEGVMKTRMQPIGSIWDRLPRVVRDLSALVGKQVRLEMDGKETELDRTIIEAIKDPLTHVVRNSVDHGIEAPAARIAAGKSAEGCLSLRAYHEGGQVNIEIADDGRGIDPEKVKAKAVERGLVTREQAARMSDRECVALIFLPGFSTAEKVTNISGRGVGMDVVKTNIEKIGGSLDVQSVVGRGTTLKVKIPLTLAIIPALTVTCGGDRYAIPQVNLLELVRLDGDAAKRGIEAIHGAPVYRLRGRLLPLVYLSRELGLGDPAPAEAVNIVVLQADDRQFGLVVDGINDTEEIVVKPLGKALKGLTAYAGATIMGDGRVALILDVLGLAQRSGVVSAVRDRALAAAAQADADRREATAQLLLLGLGHRRLAVPLDLVARLEEIPADAVEWADGAEVVQYRGAIMPIVRLSTALVTPSDADPAGVMQVVVYARGGRSVGLVVDRILDVVAAAVPRGDGRHGILGSAVIQNRVTDLLDVPGLLGDAAAQIFDAAPHTGA